MPPPDRTSAVFIPSAYNSWPSVYNKGVPLHGVRSDEIRAGGVAHSRIGWKWAAAGALVCGPCSSAEARRRLAAKKPAELFPGQREPEAAMAGLWLYFSCFEEAHALIDNPKTSEGEF